MFARSSVDSKQGTFTKPFKSTSAKGPQIESTEDRAQECFKYERTLEYLNFAHFIVLFCKSNP